MARKSRLAVAGQTHLVLQRGHDGSRVFADAVDRAGYRSALAQAATVCQVQVHALALLDTEVALLLTPLSAPALSRLMQTVGRTYVSAYNRRHGKSGTRWDGRFRCAVVEAGSARLDALLWIAGLSQADGGAVAGTRGSSPQDLPLVDPPEYWSLGNTPFEREAAWTRLLATGLSLDRAAQLRAAANGGWAIGSTDFVDQIADAAGRPARARPRGRPRLVPR